MKKTYTWIMYSNWVCSTGELSVLFTPLLEYNMVMEVTKQPTLYNRRCFLSERFFNIVNHSHKISCLVPAERLCRYNLRKKTSLSITLCRTDQFMNSFIVAASNNFENNFIFFYLWWTVVTQLFLLQNMVFIKNLKLKKKIN